MDQGGRLVKSHAPHALQWSASISLHSRKIARVGGDPAMSITTGGDCAILRNGPINFLRQYSDPRRSRVTHACIRNRVKPASSLGSDITPPGACCLETKAKFGAGSKINHSNLVNGGVT